jgi:shikimate kinase
MNLKLKLTPGIYIVGFMASGKSTIGRHLAHRLGWNFYDTDDEIEKAKKVTIADIFAARGEAEFRRIEHEILKQHVRWIERGRPAVVALGGGAFIEQANRDLLDNNGISIWLDCPLDVVVRRVRHESQAAVRPLAADPQKFAGLYESRRDSYSLADMRVPIETDEAERVVDAILQRPEFQ